MNFWSRIIVSATLSLGLFSPALSEEVESRLLTSWRAHFVAPAGPFSMTFRPQGDGSFKLLTSGAGIEYVEGGRFRAMNGQWQMQKTNGQSDGGTYSFDDQSTVTFKGSGPLVTWVKVADKPLPPVSQNPNPYAGYQQPGAGYPQYGGGAMPQQPLPGQQPPSGQQPPAGQQPWNGGYSPQAPSQWGGGNPYGQPNYGGAGPRGWDSAPQQNPGGMQQPQ